MEPFKNYLYTIEVEFSRIYSLFELTSAYQKNNSQFVQSREQIALFSRSFLSPLEIYQVSSRQPWRRKHPFPSIPLWRPYMPPWRVRSLLRRSTNTHYLRWSFGFLTGSWPRASLTPQMLLFFGLFILLFIMYFYYVLWLCCLVLFPIRLFFRFFGSFFLFFLVSFWKPFFHSFHSPVI